MRAAFQTSSVLLLAIIVFSIIYVLQVIPVEAALSSDAPCSKPLHIATVEDIAAGYPKGTPVCPDDYARSGITPESGAAKLFLSSLPKRDLSRCAPPSDPRNIERLNATFAICSARFLKAYTSTVGGVAITSAYRDGARGSAPNGIQSANECAGGAKYSNHQNGIAMDVYPTNGDYSQMWDFARANPQFGVCFPYGSKDRPHMALAGANTGEAAACANQRITSTCTGTSYDPDSINYAAPTSGISDYARQLLGSGSPQQSTAAPVGSATSEAQQSEQSQSQTTETRPTTFSEIINNAFTQATTSTVSTTSTSVGTSSVAEQVSVIAPGATTTQNATSIPIVLVIDVNDTVALHDNSAPQSISYLNDNATQLTPPPRSDTFTSADLRGSAVPSFGTPTFTNYQKTLANMRTIVLNILEYLKPFGRPAPGQTDGYY